jgi:hypothetical protein
VPPDTPASRRLPSRPATHTSRTRITQPRVHGPDDDDTHLRDETSRRQSQPEAPFAGNRVWHLPSSATTWVNVAGSIPNDLTLYTVFAAWGPRSHVVRGR